MLSAISLALLLACAASPEAPPPEKPVAESPAASAKSAVRLIVVSWDGAGDAVVDRLLAEGRLPNLRRLKATGASAEHSITSFPSKTAAGHAALWTGCWGTCNGVSTNSVLYSDHRHTLLESRRGFSSEALAAEPLFLTAAKAGRKVAVLSATQTVPVEPHVEALRRAGVDPGRYLAFNFFETRIADGFSHRALPPEVPGGERELRFTVGATPFRAVFADDPEDPVDGLDTVRLEQLDDPAGACGDVALKPVSAGSAGLGAWSPPCRVSDGGQGGEHQGNTFFRLFDLAPDGSRVLLYQRAASGCTTNVPDLCADYRGAYPAGHDEVFWRYAHGELGTPLMAGGDGAAEERVLEIVAHDVELLKRGSRFALEAWQPDVLFHYSPMVDGAGHTWLGVLDPASPVFDADLAERLWPYYAGVFEQLDDWLGELLRLGGDDTVVALVSDHGMSGIARLFHVNRVLEDAGLLARHEDGTIDLARTSILMPPSTDFFLKLNTRERAGGMLADADAEKVLAAATAALRAVRDPASGQAVVTRILTAGDFPGTGGPFGGDLYFDLASGYYPSRKDAPRAVGPTRYPWGEGGHGFFPERRDMHAIFYVHGPGVRRGVTGPAMRHIDVAPTLADLIGMRPPANAEGWVVEELMVQPEPVRPPTPSPDD